MKKLIAAVLCAVLLPCLAGCGSKSAEPAPTPIPAAEAPASEVPASEIPVAETTAPEATPEPADEVPAPDDELAKTVKTIRDLIGRPVADLYAAIGQPNDSDYESSCLVTGGKDGMLYYDEFTVYTTVYPDGTEKVYDVMRPDGTDFD